MKGGTAARIVWTLASVAVVIAALSGAQGASIAARAAGFSLAIGSLVVLTGWSGQLNLHVAAIGLGWGAYAAVGLASNGVPGGLAIVVAPLLVVPAAVLVGVIAVRFRGLELAIATLAAGLAFEQMAFQSLGKWLANVSEGTAFESSLVSLARPAGLHGDRGYALFAIVIGAVWLGVAAWVGRGRSGRTLQVVREREVVAEARGVPVFAWRVGAFVLSIAMASAGGALLAGQTGVVSPGAFSFTLSLQLLGIAVLVGVRRLEAAVVGAAIMVLSQEASGIAVLRWLSGDRADLVFGVGLIVALALRSRRRPTTVANDEVDEAQHVVPVTSRRVRSHPPTLLRVDGVDVSFGSSHVLHDVHLRVGEGEVVGLVGGNGAGKTTLFNCITGLVTPTAGRVFFADADITDVPPHRRAQRGLARTFQGVEVFAGLTVEDGLMVTARLAGTDRSENAARTRARAALSSVGIADLATADPATLPFAALRLIEIASALVAEPVLVLLDEPLAGLDAIGRARVLGAIERLRAQDRSVLIVEHDLAAVASVADRTYELVDGRAHERAEPRDPVAHTPRRRTQKGARLAVGA